MSAHPAPPSTHDAACHCGSVKFRVTLPEGLNSARRCDCSFCRMRGGVAVSANLDGITFLEGEDQLTLYQSTPGGLRNTISVLAAASTPITSGDRTRMNTGG